MFALKKPDKEQVAQPTCIAPPTIDYANPDAIQQGETYNNFGVRMCGRVNGDTAFLPPFLQRVYLSEREKQAKDEDAQRAAKQEIQNKISDKQAELERISNLIVDVEDKIQVCRNHIDEWKNQISSLRTEGEQGKNKEAKIKMWLGCIILIPLTIYLFVFYSSTFYSAFFRDFTQGNIALGTAMLDPQAIPSAFRQGIGELFFILAAPMIFLGLGFSLHFFTTQKNGMKYLKMGAIILVTFTFDCILAYLIGMKMHNVQMIYTDLPPYSMSLAIVDPNIWAVIFCGFVVYIIWGIVFDMVMTAYNDFTSNKSKIERLETFIEDEKPKIEQLKADKSQAQAKKIDISHEIERLRQDLSSSIVHYNLSVIKSSLSQFFAGWMSAMQIFNPDKAQVANEIYKQTIDSFNLNNKAEE